MQVVLVQEASSLDPVENRDRLAALVPEGADLVVLPEAYARDFGEPGSDLADVAEPLDGPFVTEVERVAAERGTTVVAGLFERGDATPYNTVVVRGGARADYRKIHLYDSFGYRESDVLSAGPLEPVTVELGGMTVGVMTCYDLRFPELARALVDRGRRGPGRARRLGRRARARSTTGRRCCGRARSRTPCTSSASASPARATPATRWWSAPWVTSSSRAATEPATLRAELDPAAVAEARRTNPSLANRRL